MKKLYFTVLCICLSVCTFSQDPYIGTAGGDGLGQYAYLEKDAVTFSRLFRNSYENIAYLSARWWITDNSSTNGDGKEFIYHVYGGPDWDPLIGWQCGGDNDGSKRTTDFIASDFSPEWTAGSDCYVSVCAKYCDDSYSPASFDGSSTYGAVGFNERHFRVIDIDTALHISTAVDIPDGNGVCETGTAAHVAGSFAINAGDFTGISLTGLFLRNDGSAMEVTDIPNGALSVYYEPVTGSEFFGDGSEVFAGTLAGDWDANTTDNIFGSTSLSIPLNGKVRVYIFLCDFTDGAINKNVNFSIINDGVSLSPSLDTYSKLRINKSGISQRLITLPVKFISLSGIRNRELVDLNWRIPVNGSGDRFVIQQSIDGIRFADAGTVPVVNEQQSSYNFRLSGNAEFFRVLVYRDNTLVTVSNILHLTNQSPAAIQLLQNPIRNAIVLKHDNSAAARFKIRLSDAAGRIIMTKNVLLAPGINSIPVSGMRSKQVLFLQLNDDENNQYNFNLLQQ